MQKESRKIHEILKSVREKNQRKMSTDLKVKNSFTQWQQTRSEASEEKCGKFLKGIREKKICDNLSAHFIDIQSEQQHQKKQASELFGELHNKITLIQREEKKEVCFMCA